MKLKVQKLLQSAFQQLTANRLEEAANLSRQALVVAPREPRALHLMGVILCRMNRADEGIPLLQDAVSIDPLAAPVWNDLGIALATAGQQEQAIAAYERALALDPRKPSTLKNLALLHVDRLEFQAAADLFARQLAITPNDLDAHWNLAWQLLLLGQLDEGWKEFEWRRQMPVFQLGPQFPGPRWSGEDLHGKTILLHAEGGFGDAIHFVRYAPLVAQRGATVIVECQQQLVSLFKTVQGVSVVIHRGEPLPKYDFHSPMMSLPLVFKTTLSSIPSDVPYLRVPETDSLAQPEPGSSGLRVGLVWSGGAAGDRHLRSRSLSIFSPLARVAGVTFVSLQFGPEGSEVVPPGMSLLRPAITGDFSHTAALIDGLDLVISVDTAVAHLAGAMGKPVWVLLPRLCDFRWMIDRADSPWYPTMRLFRQTKPGSWVEPVLSMAEALSRLLNRT